ncbi:IclR family transcriptional regulator [Solicola sp. PLA-1-18]|uniref:IclR family transcriptional regulator n=1 Tax=Solicola sp. PLA-1-18 TaxID=3380532 RepID=UPI003B7B9922
MARGDADGAGAQAPLLVLGKITQILNAFSLARPALTLRELQQATGMPTSTVQRLVANMVSYGLLDRDGDHVRTGTRMAYWAAAAVKDLDELAVVNAVLKELRDATGESACFFVAEGHQRVCVAVAQTRHPLRREVHVGQVVPITAGSAGRVLLAWEPGLLEEVLEADLPQLTDRSVTDTDELRALVERTRADGYAITVGERVDGASGLSAPAFNAAGDLVGALMLQGPTLRMPVEQCEAWLDPLVEQAERITRTLGGRLPR